MMYSLPLPLFVFLFFVLSIGGVFGVRLSVSYSKQIHHTLSSQSDSSHILSSLNGNHSSSNDPPHVIAAHAIRSMFHQRIQQAIHEHTANRMHIMNSDGVSQADQQHKTDASMKLLSETILSNGDLFGDLLSCASGVARFIIEPALCPAGYTREGNLCYSICPAGYEVNPSNANECYIPNCPPFYSLTPIGKCNRGADFWRWCDNGGCKQNVAADPGTYSYNFRKHFLAIHDVTVTNNDCDCTIWGSIIEPLGPPQTTPRLSHPLFCRRGTIDGFGNCHAGCNSGQGGDELDFGAVCVAKWEKISACAQTAIETRLTEVINTLPLIPNTNNCRLQLSNLPGSLDCLAKNVIGPFKPIIDAVANTGTCLANKRFPFGLEDIVNPASLPTFVGQRIRNALNGAVDEFIDTANDFFPSPEQRDQELRDGYIRIVGFKLPIDIKLEQLAPQIIQQFVTKMNRLLKNYGKHEPIIGCFTGLFPSNITLPIAGANGLTSVHPHPSAFHTDNAGRQDLLASLFDASDANSLLNQLFESINKSFNDAALDPINKVFDVIVSKLFEIFFGGEAVQQSVLGAWKDFAYSEAMNSQIKYFQELAKTGLIKQDYRLVESSIRSLESIAHQLTNPPNSVIIQSVLDLIKTKIFDWLGSDESFFHHEETVVSSEKFKAAMDVIKKKPNFESVKSGASPTWDFFNKIISSVAKTGAVGLFPGFGYILKEFILPKVRSLVNKAGNAIIAALGLADIIGTVPGAVVVALLSDFVDVIQSTIATVLPKLLQYLFLFVYDTIISPLLLNVIKKVDTLFEEFDRNFDAIATRTTDLNDLEKLCLKFIIRGGRMISRRINALYKSMFEVVYREPSIRVYAESIRNFNNFARIAMQSAFALRPELRPRFTDNPATPYYRIGCFLSKITNNAWFDILNIKGWIEPIFNEMWQQNWGNQYNPQTCHAKAKSVGHAYFALIGKDATCYSGDEHTHYYRYGSVESRKQSCSSQADEANVGRLIFGGLGNEVSRLFGKYLAEDVYQVYRVINGPTYYLAVVTNTNQLFLRFGITKETPKGTAWSPAIAGDVRSIDIQPDGTIWVVWLDGRLSYGSSATSPLKWKYATLPSGVIIHKVRCVEGTVWAMGANGNGIYFTSGASIGNPDGNGWETVPSDAAITGVTINPHTGQATVLQASQHVVTRIGSNYLSAGTSWEMIDRFLVDRVESMVGAWGYQRGGEIWYFRDNSLTDCYLVEGSAKLLAVSRDGLQVYAINDASGLYRRGGVTENDLSAGTGLTWEYIEGPIPGGILFNAVSAA